MGSERGTEFPETKKFSGENNSGVRQGSGMRLLRNFALLIAAVVTLYGFYRLSQYNYLLFHSSVEVFSIVIAFAIFAIAWNGRHIMDSNYLLVVGIALFFVGGVNLLHTLAYRGMNVFPGIDANWATQLWIAARYMLSFSLLAALLFVNRKPRITFVFLGYGLAFALVLLSIFYWKIFPTAYIEGVGLTPFKIASEYAIALILALSILFLIKIRKNFAGSITKLMIAAMASLIAAEMAFTLYTDVYGIANMAGHLLNVVAFYFIYKALVETGLSKPYDLMFHTLKQSEISLQKRTTELAAVNSQLVHEAAERARVEEALRHNEQRWSTTLSSIGDAVIATDLSSQITFMNGVAEKLTGWTLNESIGKPISKVFHIINEQTRLEAENPVTKVLEKGTVVDLANHTVLVRKDTSEVIIDDSGAPIKDRDGKTVGVVLVFRDVTERRKAEKALHVSEERLRLKLDSVLSPDAEVGEQELANIIDVKAVQLMMDDLYAVIKIGFALIDLKGNVLVSTGWQDICTNFHRINQQTLKNCIESDLELSGGLEQGQIRQYKCKNHMWDVVTPLFIGGKHVGNVFFGQFFFENEKVDRNLFASQAEKYGFNKEEYLAAFDRIPRFSKEKIDYLMKFYSKLSEIISKLSYSNIKLAKLLSKEKMLQDELEKYSKDLEVLVEEKTKQLTNSERLAAIGQTAGMVGHDIRNPLQAIAGELYLEKDEVESLPDGDAKRNLQQSLKDIEDNLFYINKIIADLQDFARPLSPKKEKVDVNSIIEHALSIVTIPDNLDVSIAIAQNFPALNADVTMMRRILANLIQNAVQAMPNGGKLTLTAEKKSLKLLITVQDSGEGISDEVKSKLFTPLVTTKSKGQGFGLAVVKRLIEAQDGNITFESEQGNGTKFIIEFPA